MLNHIQFVNWMEENLIFGPTFVRAILRIYYYGHFYFKLFDVLLVITLRGITLG